MGEMADLYLDNMYDTDMWRDEQWPEIIKDSGDACEECSTGIMIVRRNRIHNAQFLGCSNFPKCTFSCTISDNTI